MILASISSRRFRISIAGVARQLLPCQFMGAAENVMLIGGPGAGKSYGTTAFGA